MEKYGRAGCARVVDEIDVSGKRCVLVRDVDPLSWCVKQRRRVGKGVL